MLNHGVTFNLGSAKVCLPAIFETYFSHDKEILIALTDSIHFLLNYAISMESIRQLIFIWVLTSLSTYSLGHITMGSFVGRGNQYIQLVKVLYCKLPANGKYQLSHLKSGQDTNSNL